MWNPKRRIGQPFNFLAALCSLYAPEVRVQSKLKSLLSRIMGAHSARVFPNSSSKITFAQKYKAFGTL
jgi:hypothetical protein